MNIDILIRTFYVLKYIATLIDSQAYFVFKTFQTVVYYMSPITFANQQLNMNERIQKRHLIVLKHQIEVNVIFASKTF